MCHIYIPHILLKLLSRLHHYLHCPIILRLNRLKFFHYIAYILFVGCNLVVSLIVFVRCLIKIGLLRNNLIINRLLNITLLSFFISAYYIQHFLSL